MTRPIVLFLVFLLFLSGCAPANSLQSQTATPTPPSPEPSAAVQPGLGSPTQVVEPKGVPAEASWMALVAPDGNVYLADTNSGYKKQITQDGTGLPQAGTSPAQQATYYGNLSWSSDGKLLAFRSTTWADSGNGAQFHFNLWVYDAERNEVRQLPQQGDPSGLAFRPGTHLLAYDNRLDAGYFVNGQPDAAKAHGIMGLDVDTGETREMVKPEHGYSLSAPRWSPDGSILGFVEEVGYEAPTPFGLYDFKNGVYRAWNQTVGNYTFAPDGQHLAYDRLIPGVTPEKERIWVGDLLGKDEQLFSPQAGPIAHTPAWSPEGDLLAYVLGSPLVEPGQEKNDLMVQPLAGTLATGEPRRLGSFSLIGPLAWSPDGTRLAFSTGLNDQRLIKVVNVADGSVKDLGAGFDPVWQPPTTVPSSAAAPQVVETRLPEPTRTPLSVAETPAASRINLDMLKNFTYRVPDFDVEAVLKNGDFANDKIKGRLVEPVAFGDLNGDSRPDAVVILAFNSGGSGTFFDLFALLDQNGAPVQAGSAYIGDRQAIKNLQITGGRIVLDYLTQGLNAPLCCPNEHRLRSYTVDNEKLRLASEQVLESPEAQATPLPDIILIDQPASADRLARPQQVRGRIAPVPIEKELVYRITDSNGAQLLQGKANVEGDVGGTGSFIFDFTLENLPTGLVQLEIVDSANGVLRGRSVVVLISQ